MNRLPKLFNIDEMSNEELIHLFVMGQTMADAMDRRGDPEGCLEYSELWCAVEDLLKARGVR